MDDYVIRQLEWSVLWFDYQTYNNRWYWEEVGLEPKEGSMILKFFVHVINWFSRTETKLFVNHHHHYHHQQLISNSKLTGNEWIWRAASGIPVLIRDERRNYTPANSSKDEIDWTNRSISSDSICCCLSWQTIDVDGTWLSLTLNRAGSVPERDTIHLSEEGIQSLLQCLSVSWLVCQLMDGMRGVEEGNLRETIG